MDRPLAHGEPLLHELRGDLLRVGNAVDQASAATPLASRGMSRSTTRRRSGINCTLPGKSMGSFAGDRPEEVVELMPDECPKWRNLIADR